MTKKMLIDATHEEETRVAVVDGGRLEEFDYESAFRKPLKGNIFLAKVTRVEPSLQAAFVNFGGNRHGFLPFSEIHPDYFRIPVADREALMAEQEEALREHDEAAAADDDETSEDVESAETDDDAEEEVIEELGGEQPPVLADDAEDVITEEAAEEKKDEKPKRKSRAKKAKVTEVVEEAIDDEHSEDEVNGNVKAPEEDEIDDEELDAKAAEALQNGEPNADEGNNRGDRGRGRGRGGRNNNRGGRGRNNNRGDRGGRNVAHGAKRVETFGGDDATDEQRFRFNLRRKYKIQEVIKRGQIMLVQVSKEERGNKGAAVGSYLSLPGRYCVLMPNSPRAGGVSRKISNYKDRAKMRDMMKELEVPKGMSVILRTAGVTRTKTEVKRDLDYLMKLWDKIRGLTMESSAPAMVYEEADLVKRSVRDLYTRDIEEIHVAGETGYKTAKDFMKMMIPSHAKRVIEYKDTGTPLFSKFKIEEQIADIGETQVTLKSGGYLIINPTEALVSIDVNSGKATKERHIEETALKTNLEAAEEVARQLRLRDLGGLVVIDFIDMEDRRNNGKVERKMRDALSGDKARIQMGRISSFGLMEMSRQRMSASLGETQFETCAHCDGTGRTRTSDAASILVLRDIEAEGIKGRAAEVMVHVSGAVAIYILNNKRQNLADLEARYNFKIVIRVDETLGAAGCRVEVSKPLNKNGKSNDDNEDGDNNNNEEDSEGRSRRRGRRGGRRRGGRDRDQNREGNDNDNADKVENAGGESESKAAEQTQDQPQSEDKGEEKKTRRPRRSAAKKSEDDAQVTADSAPEVAKDEKPKRGRKPAAKKVEEAPVEDAAKEDKPKRGRKPAAKKEAPETVTKAEVSNDDAPAAEPVVAKMPEPKEYETVNEAPKSKKKGWWKKKD
jgi:ribonuclease E